MSEDIECTVVVFSVTYKEGGVPYLLYIEDGYGPDSIKEFKFPAYFDTFRNFNPLQRRNFLSLLQKGELINITFDKDYRLLAISGTDEDKVQEYLIIHDSATNYFSSIETEKEVPLYNTTTSTCTTTTSKPELIDIRRVRRELGVPERNKRFPPYVPPEPIFRTNPAAEKPLWFKLESNGFAYSSLISGDEHKKDLFRSFVINMCMEYPHEPIYEAMVKELG